MPRLGPFAWWSDGPKRGAIRPVSRKNGYGICKVEPLSQTWEERERAIRAGPQSLTALLMGDPLPGRSALDREIVHALP